jgi:hypothetical protein
VLRFVPVPALILASVEIRLHGVDELCDRGALVRRTCLILHQYSAIVYENLRLGQRDGRAVTRSITEWWQAGLPRRAGERIAAVGLDEYIALLKKFVERAETLGTAFYLNPKIAAADAAASSVCNRLARG